jgi:hypothetical protein
MSQCKPATKKELAWCERLRKVLSAHPRGLWIFVADGCLEVMKEPVGGREFGDTDQRHIIASYSSEIHSDGGGR